MKKLLHSFWPALFWSAIVIFLLSIPGSDLPDESSFLSIPHFDKWVHLGIFALFVILWCWALSLKKNRRNLTRSFIWVTLGGIVLGYLMELAQKYLVSNRDYDLWDVVADSAGAIIGLLFSLRVFTKK
ncbi:VanZ family protein [Niabella yanshanensis]|uniref:VanZ family protein n=1 Tax=Niabella yanshanensis TaxID=577386 RepID=A0ABZ0W4I2_9BACT|nr:VanZ family protein [Niabella yanshanensis]WQD37422.1 VanZ family protein [Niabella yanshanensis]